MKNRVLLRAIIYTLIVFFSVQAYSAETDKDKRRDKVEEEIWALENDYFTNLYKANYERILAIGHSQFLGWPGGLPQPIDREENARFMKKLIPRPTSCTIKIERAGIRMLRDVALTQYTLYVNCSEKTGVTKITSSRITHTWVKEGPSWKLLGGMSFDK
ncbi:MAG: hypothetical protein CVU54_04430 [Deltaproteobacteria bacterium HGW-Deltaproteobacteria-12]|jgi:hypothetical protein|nr:MAG: hypothetical protein CVU54_04430 [Deltaproteobacteria bacterium HGW-Deltaproteobacteria-12]